MYVLSALLIVTLLALQFAEPASLILQIYLSRAEPALPLPVRPPPEDLAEARRQDVADLRLLPNFDRSFSPEAKLAFSQGVDALDAKAAALSPAGFEMAVSRLVALAGNAHTTVNKAQRVRSFGRAPLRFAWFADGLYIVRTTPPADALLGRRVVSIDGRPAAQALADLQPYLSGTSERARDDSPPLLDCPALLQVMWPDTDGRHLAVGLADGSVEQVGALPPGPDAFALRPVMVIGPAAPSGDWKSVLGAAPQLPLSLREPDRVAYSAPLENGGLYIRINANEDDANGPLAEQLAAIAVGKPPAGWHRIVLDLRFNDGGDELKTMAFAKSLPDLLSADGNLWIVTGNASFSAAIITAARAKYFAGGRAHIVGEAVGDHHPFWNVGGAPLVLRNSGIAIGHAYFKQDWTDGCYSIGVCNPLQSVYGVAAGDLSPEVTVGWSFADYAAGRDTVIERVRELAR
ncbi:MAG: hypothetical protein JWM91_1465 [Rhodospirillales bacterium]|nr:hypothetical protein [Rhodospirillales bacterium]